MQLQQKNIQVLSNEKPSKIVGQSSVKELNPSTTTQLLKQLKEKNLINHNILKEKQPDFVEQSSINELTLSFIAELLIKQQKTIDALTIKVQNLEKILAKQDMNSWADELIAEQKSNANAFFQFTPASPTPISTVANSNKNEDFCGFKKGFLK